MSDPADMPVFTIKAKDALAYPAVKAYQDLCLEHGLVMQAQSVGHALLEIRGWQRDNIDLTKLPDHDHVPAGGVEADKETP